MSWNVYITARVFRVIGKPALQLLEDAGCKVTHPEKTGPLKAAELLAALPGFDAVLCSPDEYSAAVLLSPELSQVKILSRWGVGYDSIDAAAATEAGIVVAYTPGLLNETVADYTFGLLLAIARRIHVTHRSMADGKWANEWGHDVFGKTLGLIGCGRIGQAVARRGAGFNMRVIGFDIAPDPNCGMQFVRTLDELLGRSDFICLHAALTPQNRGLIGEEQLRKMKPTAYLINTARGSLVQEEPLIRALQEGWIAGAALDVFNKEPLAPDHPFRGAPNLLLAPHQSSFARETGERVCLAAAQAIVDAMQGRKPQWLVNPEVVQAPNLRVKLNTL